MSRKSLVWLLSRQEKTLQKDPRFIKLKEYLKDDRRLRSVKLGTREYRLLNRGTIRPEHVTNFVQTYRMPASPFFLLYFQLKQDYEQKKLTRKQEKKDFILKKLQELPWKIRQYLSALAVIEQHINHAGKNPVWNRVIVPSTKKASMEYGKYSLSDWKLLTQRFGGQLGIRYPGIPKDNWEKMFCAFLLGYPPKPGLKLPASPEEIQRRYRKMSLQYHPDTGGNEKIFRMLKEARDTLLEP